MVALPREFTSRFGEVVWSNGGVGFGWWPSCIFDPRLTEGSARQTARKNLGKKHLVYFFECQEAPFAVLSSSKIIKWHEGLSENYHLGKTARSSGKNRTFQFQQALQAAIFEEDKPLELRLDWNRPEEQPQLLPLPKKSKKRKGGIPDVHMSPQGVIRPSYGSDSDDSLIKRRRKKRKKEDAPLFCKIYKQIALQEETGAVEHIGFVQVPSKRKSRFADVRRAIKKDLVPEALPPNTKWKFYISTLGRVTIKQETSLGPVIPFLRSGVGGNTKNAGSIGDPITVVIVIG